MKAAQMGFERPIGENESILRGLHLKTVWSHGLKVGCTPTPWWCIV